MSPACRSGVRGRSPRPSTPGPARAPGSSSRRIRQPACTSSWPRTVAKSAAVIRLREAPPAGAVSLVERSLNGGFAGGPDGLVFVTDRELFGSVRVRRPRALRRVVPRDILERLTPGDLVVHIDHGIARYERMLRRGAARRGARLPRAGVPRQRPDLRPRRADRADLAVRRRGEPVAQPPRRPRLAEDQGPRQEGRHRPRQGTARALRVPQRRPRARVRARQPVAAGDGGVVPVRGDRRPAAGDGRGEGRHGVGPADGPAGRRRRRLRQDRGRAACRLQGDPGRQAGRGPGPDDRARGAALPRRSASATRRSRSTSGCCRGSSRRRSRRRRSPGSRDGSVDLVIGTHRLLSKDVQFRDLGLVVVDEEQRFGVAAKERLKQLRNEVDVLTLSATPIPRTLNLALAGVRDLSRHRDAAGGSPADPDARRRGVGRASCATRSCASSTAAGRCSTSTTASRRSRRRPISCARCCPARGSSSATDRWPKASSRR